MDKRYQFNVDGKTYFKNVAPQNEEKFLELYGQYEPTLISDEPGKSQGTSQSQNNQQENTDLSLEDTSSVSQKKKDKSEAYFTANQFSFENVKKVGAEDAKPLEYKIDNEGNRLYYKAGGTDATGSRIEPGFYKEVEYDYDRSLGVRFEHDSYGKILDNVAYGANTVVQALPSLKDKEEREKTKRFMKNRVNNIPEDLYSQLVSASQVTADFFTMDLDGIQSEKEKAVRQRAEEFIIDMYENLEKIEADGEGVVTPLGTLKRKDAGVGIVKGAKQASAADVLSGVFGAATNMATTYIPAAMTGGLSLPVQIAAPMYTEYNKSKAKSIYGDDPEAIKKLVESGQTEVAVPLALGAVATGLEYVGFKGLERYISSVPGKGKMFAELLYTGSREGLTELGQVGVETLNSELGGGKTIEEASKKAWDVMTSDEGVEMFLNGFLGSTQVGVAGRTTKSLVNRALRNDEVSIGEVNDKISNLAALNNQKNTARNKDVKDAIDLDIKAAEKDLRDYVTNKRKISDILTSDQKLGLINILNEKDNITSKIDKLKDQLQNKEITNKDYGYAVRSLNNQNKRLNLEIDNIKKQATQAAAQRTTESVKKQIKQAGLEGEVTELTADEISKLDEEGLDSKSAATSFGFIKQKPDNSFEIVLNKDKPMEGTAAHEFMHAVLFKTLGGNSELQTNLGDALEQHVTTLGGDLTNVGKRLAQYGKWQKDKDGNITGFEKDANFGEETITIMSESILDGSLKFNEGFFTKIGDVVRRFSQNYLGKEIKFNTGKDVYNFIKDYNNSIKTGKVNKAIIQVAKEGAKGKLVEKKTETVAKETVTQQSKDAKPNVDDLGSKTRWNNNTWKKEGADKAIQEIKNKRLIDGLIAAKYKVRPVPANFVDDVLNSTFFVNHVRSFNPEVNDSLFGWINSQIRNKAGSVFNQNEKGKIPKEVKTVEADARTTEGQPVIQVEDVSANMETLTDNINYFETEVQPESTESKAEQSKLRKEIGIGNLGKSEIFKKVKTALATSKAVDEKGFLKSYENNLANLLEPTIARILNDPAKLKKFRKGILEAIPIKTLVQMQKFLPEKIFVKDHGRQTNLTNLSKFVEKGLLPADILNNTPESKKRRAAGVRVYERLDTTTKQFENYIDAPVVDTKTGKRSGTRGNNRAKIISEVSKAIGRDATPEALTPEFVEDYLNIKDLKGKITPERVIEKISEQIERPPTLQFSKNTSEVESIFIKSLFDIEVNGKDKILGIYNIDKTFKIKDEKDIDVYVEALKTDVFKLGPKEMWFGPKGGTAFTSSAKNIGMSSSDPLWPKFVKKIKDLEKDPNIKYGSAIPGVKPSEVWTLRNKYNTLLKDPATIRRNKKQIIEFNKKVAAIHETLWGRINDSIKKDKQSARAIATYLGLVANDRAHWHKLGAQVEGFSKKITGARYELEHAMPATNAYLYLLDAALAENVNFEAAYSLLVDNYKLIALDKAMDNKLRNARTEKGYSLQRRMPDNWSVVDGRWHQRYFNEIVGKQNKGIDPASIETLDGQTFADKFNINADGLPSIIQESKSNINNITNAKKAQDNIYKFSKDDKAKGMSTFDFDETVGVSENFVIAKKGNDVQRIASNEWPFVGEQLAKDGYKFDFSDFNKVTKGKPGPLFEKMKNQIKKYGPENVFILTARAPQSEQAIHDWLKSNGINIPRKNVTGLGRSEGQAKADWMLEKFAEGYNDMYFVDDALPNVKAVKDVLDQLDIKSKVVQAKIKFSKDGPLDFNKILEQSKGVYAGKKFSAQEARKIGVGKGRLKFFVPPSAEDFKGLVYSFLGRGREGDAHAAWFKEKLFDPFAKGIREWNNYKQAMSDDYQAIKKQFKTVGKKLNKKVPGTVFTNDNAVRVYLWDKAGFEIPGITELQIEKLVNHVNNNSDLKNFADALGVISRVPEGYIKPEGYWAVQSVASDLSNTVLKAGRKDFLAEWIENKNIVFSEENLNKIEAIYGTDFRDALENMLHRMETGTNRPSGKSKQVNMWLDWVNGSVAATMFVNVRSAALQTISTVNFVNMSDNNIFKAAAAFANQPQYWKDFAYIFNSPMLKQRRAGLQIDVSASEITKAYNQGKSKPEAILAYLLEKGFLPTQIADSFAISMGGAGFYRNRIKTYLKKGMSEAKAKKQAWLDFQEVAEETQQSSRPDLISMQQAGPMGRLILAWQNTPMQMTRLTKKALSDLVKRRKTPGYNQIQSDMGNISSIIYYGVAQNLIFGALQTGLMFLLFGWDEDEERKKKLELRTLNGALDTLLRGTGIYGAAVSTLKNVLLKWKEEREGPAWKRDDWNVAQEAINLSPPIGSKMRKLIGAIRTEKWNKGVSKEIGFRIENPNLSIAANWTEALTNIPVARVVNKANNVEEALNSNNDIWQRVALVSGWSRWSVGVEDEELKAAKEAVKEKREQKKEEERKKKKEEKKKEEQKKAPKRYKCRKRKADGNRCKNTTTHKSQYCYAHR